MKPFKRKDSCTFKRETSLDNQERIYLLERTADLQIRSALPRFVPWAFLKHDEPTARERCRGYQLPRFGQQCGQPAPPNSLAPPRPDGDN